MVRRFVDACRVFESTADLLCDLRRAPLYLTSPVIRRAARFVPYPTEQPTYVNTVVAGRPTSRLLSDADAVAARRLVGWCKRLETEAGRPMDGTPGHELDGPRPLDVDLLLLGSRRLRLPALAHQAEPAEKPTQPRGSDGPGSEEPRTGESWSGGIWPGRITVPHPRLAERRFVLRPLADLLPDLELPGEGTTVRAALAALDEQLGGQAGEQRMEPLHDEAIASLWRREGAV